MAGLEVLLTGRTLVDRYRIGDVIGRGGFAAVYRAFDERLRRTVAVKVITLSASDPAFRDEIQKRFHREALAVARIQHPNVVAVYDFGVDPELGMDFLVMELLEGEDLADRLARAEPLPGATALRILREVAFGVNEGHRVGLIHRDIKPGNVFLSQAGEPGRFRVRVLDFGIALFTVGDEATQLTRTGGIPLSSAYASPEQLRAEQDITPASDVFSLGVIGYQLLTGERPFPTDRWQTPGGTTAEPIPIQQLNPSISDALAGVIHRAMAASPLDRYADAGEFAHALRAAVAEGDARAPVATVARNDGLSPEAAVAEGYAPRVAAAEQQSPSRALEDTVPRRERSAYAAPVESAAAPESPRLDPSSPHPVRPHRLSMSSGAKWSALLLLGLLVIAGGWWAMSRGGSGERVGEQASSTSSEPQEQPPDGTAREPIPGDLSGSAPSTTGSEPESPSSATPSATTSRPQGEAQREPGGEYPPAAAPPSAPSSPESRSSAAPPTASPPAASSPRESSAATATRLNREGERLFATGDFRAAADRFRLAVQTVPTNALFLNNLGWALYQLNDFDEATRYLDEAARQDARRAIVHANIGEVRWAQGNKAGAIAAYERFLQLNTDPRRRQIAEQRLAEMRASEPRTGA